MGADEAIELGRQAITLLVVLSLPVLITGLVVALIVSVMQAITQVQDQTLSLVPKIIAMLVAVIVVGPWMLSRLVDFGKQMFSTLP